MDQLYNLRCPICNTTIAVINPHTCVAGSKFLCHNDNTLITIGCGTISFQGNINELIKIFGHKTSELTAPNILTLYLKEENGTKNNKNSNTEDTE